MNRKLISTNLVVILLLALLPVIAAEEDAEGWVKLFDGETLDGWVQKGGSAKYQVENGEIVGSTVPNTENSFLCTTEEYSDFILELEFMVDSTLNSGIQIRSHSFDEETEVEWRERTIQTRAGRVHGYQVEIDPNQDGKYTGNPPNRKADGEVIPAGAEPRRWTGGIYDEARRGWLNNLTENEAAREAFKPGEWNQFRIECRGDSIKTWVNAVPAADLEDSMTASGFIALQVHSVGNNTNTMQVRWKNIRLKEL